MPHYYLGVIVIGYCAGYFLIICSPAFNPRQRLHSLMRLAGYVGTGAIALLFVPRSIDYQGYVHLDLIRSRCLRGFDALYEEGIGQKQLQRSVDRTGRSPSCNLDCIAIASTPGHKGIAVRRTSTGGLAKDKV